MQYPGHETKMRTFTSYKHPVGSIELPNWREKVKLHNMLENLAILMEKAFKGTDNKYKTELSSNTILLVLL